MQEEKKQYTVLFSLGDLCYDDDFLQKAAKIKGIKEIWPVVEIPVNIKIEDYTKETAFLGIDFNAFGNNPDQEKLGNTPMLLLGTKSLQGMKDYNGHSISQKQQAKYLQSGKDLNVSYALTSLSEGSQKQNTYFPCKVITCSEKEADNIYIPLFQAQKLCQKSGKQLTVTKVLLKIDGKRNLEKAKQLFIYSDINSGTIMG